MRGTLLVVWRKLLFRAVLLLLDKKEGKREVRRPLFVAFLAVILLLCMMTFQQTVDSLLQQSQAFCEPHY
jgi:hypothetical protein